MKPENILLDDLGNICLADFGMSKILSAGDNGTTSSIVGTPEYIAPEVFTQDYGAPADWWSFGTLM